MRHKQSNVLMSLVVGSCLYPYCGLGTIETIKEFTKVTIPKVTFFAFVSNAITKGPDL